VPVCVFVCVKVTIFTDIYQLELESRERDLMTGKHSKQQEQCLKKSLKSVGKINCTTRNCKKKIHKGKAFVQVYFDIYQVIAAKCSRFQSKSDYESDFEFDLES